MLQAGTIVGCSFVIRHLIAEGGMAQVYLAESLTSGQIFALKRSSVSLSEEAELINNFCHPNIVKGIEFFQGLNESFLLMEYIDGKEVDYFIAQAKSRPFHDRACLVLAIGLQVCGALNYIFVYPDKSGSKLEVIHKDISPQNLLISFLGVVKLLDFGVAQTKNNLNLDNREILKGNLPYMSPEQLLGQKLGQASDIYALALVLSEIIRGEKWRPLKKTDDPFSRFKPSGPGRELLEVLRKGLNEDPAFRTDSSEAFQRELSRIHQKFGSFVPSEFLAKSFLWPQQVSTPSYFIRVLGLLGLIAAMIAILIGLGNQIFVPDLKPGADYFGVLPYQIFAPLRSGR